MITHTDSFFFSSLSRDNPFQSLAEFRLGMEELKKTGIFNVEQIPLHQLDQWHFTVGRNCLEHASGKFFKIEGLRIKTNFGTLPDWDQPIINQPEIGILGILTKVIQGTRYFLMQLKMEPGNINKIQLSPTVQATKSNFSRVHQGKLPPYLGYFNGSSPSGILIDQLQSEQGARFLEKRNRNMVVEVKEDIPVCENFCWLTLGEIKHLLSMDNLVNMDCRSVLSTIPLIDDPIVRQIRDSGWLRSDPVIIQDVIITGFDRD